MDKEKFLKDNEAFIYWMTQKQPFCSINKDDALQQAYLGAWKALQKVDQDRDESAILSYMRTYIHRHLFDFYNRFEVTSANLSRTVNRTIAALNGKENVTRKDVKEQYPRDNVSDEQINLILSFIQKDNEDSYEDYHKQTDPNLQGEMEDEEMRIELREVMEKALTRRERDMIARSYGIGCESQPQKEIASIYDLTPSRVSQIIDVALDKLYEEGYHLKKYLGG